VPEPAAARHTPGTPAAGAASAAAAGRASRYRGRDELKAFADEVAERRSSTGLGADPARQAQWQPRVARLIMPPPVGTAKNWAAYRDRFVEPRRVTAGRPSGRPTRPNWQRAEKPVRRAGRGRGRDHRRRDLLRPFSGGFRVLDALATLSLRLPHRPQGPHPFFRTELEEFLVWCHAKAARRQRSRARSPAPSACPQFMPGSINRHAVDFDGDGHVDLQRSSADAIGSVAHYLQRAWLAARHADALRRQGPGRRRADPRPAAGTRHPAQLQRRAVRRAGARWTRPKAPPRRPAGPGGGAERRRRAELLRRHAELLPITRYNWSSYYAMAVITLAEAVKTRASQRHGRPSAREWARTIRRPMRLLHTMLRVGDLQRSIDFYTQVMGMTLLRTSERPDRRSTTLAFVGYGRQPRAGRDRTDLQPRRVDAYEIGTAFGHIAIGVPDVTATCDAHREKAAALATSSRASPGRSRAAAPSSPSCTDPDGYKIELIQR
jgi:membrane-bound lytic murein transglycosylase B